MPTIEDLRATQSVLLTPDDAGLRRGDPAAGTARVPRRLRQTSYDPKRSGRRFDWAAAEGVEVAVRSGGHGPWVPVPGGLLVDLGAFAQVDVGDDDVVAIGPALVG